MTVSLSGNEVATKIANRFPEAVVETDNEAILLKSESIFEVVEYLQNNPDLEFDYLNYIAAVDYYDYFELVYQLTSINYNHSLVLKTRCYDRENPSVPSIVSLYKGADFQEREIYDLMGINFAGHPNMKRIVLWDGFKGHPLRKDYC